MENWYVDAAHQVEQFVTDDGKILTNDRVDALVQAMAAFAPPATGQTELPQEYQAALVGVIGGSWQ